MTGGLQNGARPVMRMLRLEGFPIFQQLLLEERLLRTSNDNWCVINDGTSPPAIVMGISGKPEKLLDVEKVVKDDLCVIKRFSGGGTVVVDEDTLFVSLICSRSAVPDLQLYPRHIMNWTELLDSRMAYLKVPERAPAYRQARDHSDFICRLQDFFPSREYFVDTIAEGLEHHFILGEENLNDVVDEFAERSHISSTNVLSRDDLAASLKHLS
ncbi:hypothetical protein AXG93_3943s1330 [Marchantia polymorpha subsp. ruderalis]|uniref:BPL/LPL catalytic domain-containing protein n=1 Tax=Marchantia polymorpha subsp. ruderalis TaxID=1480154 RepID=A0A176WEY0_MARPO|nr:hypothetical protein AXG93_3943s1330 [Marchantia polymorpha subsp. ruderalis]